MVNVMPKKGGKGLADTLGVSLGGAIASGYELLVVADGVAAAHPLPSEGAVSIGRDPACDVWIDHPSVSRRHAAVAVSGGKVTIQDLGSANGTVVRGQRVKSSNPTLLTLGELVEVGGTMLLLHRRSTSGARPWTHGQFEIRLDDACAAALASGGELALLRLRVTNGVKAGRLLPVFAHVCPEGEVGVYGPGEYEFLLRHTSPTVARELSIQLREACEAFGADVRTGLACFPSEALSAHALLARANAMARERPYARGDVDAIVASPAMEKLHRLVEKVSAGSISILVLGETGVGKEVMAATVHRLSPRKEKPFVPINCAALSESLLESELFGYEKGAFTGATSHKPGLFEIADGGTVFLDEIGELPMSLQVKLLRVLEEKAVRRVGGLKAKSIDVRLVAATNRDLEAEVSVGNFREDLLYRLNGVILQIPPLRERTEELEPLCSSFAKAAADELGMASVPAVTPAVFDIMRSYRWPGNIRELRNVIERAVLLCDGEITPEDLPIEKMQSSGASNDAPSPSVGAAESSQKQRIIDALAACGGNQTRAAELLGVTRRTLTNWLNKYDIPRPIKGG